MYTVDNKFEIGEECYTVIREPIQFECPICKGKGEFTYNGYEIKCKQCDGSGKLYNAKQSVLKVCKVKIRRMIVSIWENTMTIKYKVNSVGQIMNAKNRYESNLFKTYEEAEEYCKAVNCGEIGAAF